MPEKILIIDDDPSIQYLLMDILENYNAKAVGNSKDAMKLLQKEYFDVILSDIKMPQGSGIQLLKEVQQRSPEIPVVLITGHGSKDLAVLSLRQQAFDFLEKPFSEKELLNSIQKAIKHRKSIQKKTKLFQKIEESQKQLKKLNQQILLSHEKERKKLAQEVHDELGQLIALMKMEFSCLQKHLIPQEEQKKLSQIHGLLEKGIELSRKIATHIQPATLNSFPAREAFLSLIEETQKHKKISIFHDIAPLTINIPEPVKNIFFRILQDTLDCLSNSTSNSKILVKLYHENGKLNMEIESPHPIMPTFILDIEEKIQGLGGNLFVNKKQHTCFKIEALTENLRGQLMESV